MDAIRYRINELKKQTFEIKHATRISLEGVEEEIARLEALRGHVVETDTTAQKIRAVEEARSAYRRHFSDPRD